MKMIIRARVRRVVATQLIALAAVPLLAGGAAIASDMEVDLGAAPIELASSLPQQPSPLPSNVAGGVTVRAPADAATTSTQADIAAQCAQYNTLLTRAEPTYPAPPACEAVFPLQGGLRPLLAEHGIAVSLSAAPTTVYDLEGHEARNPVYNGQNFTVNTGVDAQVVIDLGRYGVPGHAQLTASAVWYTDTYENNIPRYLGLFDLVMNQQFFDRQLEIQYGYFSLARSFYGIIVGNNSASAALGPSSVIPFEVGMSSFTPTENAEVTLRSNDWHVYNSVAVGRSTTPLGLPEETRINDNGFAWNVKGANPLVIDEIGYRISASASGPAIWIRLGGIYNFSRFDNFDGSGTSRNQAAYLNGTLQFFQPTHSAQGAYLDVKLDYAPQLQNLYTKDAQATLFYIGPFKSRPADLVSLSFSQNEFSKVAAYYTHLTGASVWRATTSGAASYVYRVTSGSYLISGLTYTNHPSFSPARNEAFIWQETLNLVF